MGPGVGSWAVPGRAEEGLGQPLQEPAGAEGCAVFGPRSLSHSRCPGGWGCWETLLFVLVNVFGSLVALIADCGQPKAPRSDGELAAWISWGQRRKMEGLGEPDTPCPTT